MAGRTKPKVHWSPVHTSRVKRISKPAEFPGLPVNGDVDARANDVDGLESREITVLRGSLHVCRVGKAYGLNILTVHEQMPL